MTITSQQIPTPFGHVLLSKEGNQLRLFLSADKITNPKPITYESDLQQAIHALQLYFQNPADWQALADEFPMPAGTAFQEKVWHAISQIPAGQTLTYQALAAQVGSHPRAVANACGANKRPIFIPCHRVMAKSGLGGFMRKHPKGLMIKRWLLQHEGVDLA